MKVLFIGSYLSKHRGSKSVAEKLQVLLKNEVDIQLCSTFKNKILRLAEIGFTVLFFRGKTIVLDVYSGPAFIIAEIAAFLGKLRKLNVVMILRGGKLAEFANDNSNRISRLFNKAGSIYTPSLFLQDSFKTLNFNFQYLPNPVDLTHFQFERTDVKPHTLLWVRAFTEIYNPELAVKTLSEVKKTFKDATLTMIGPDNGLLNKTKKLIEELGLTNSIEITGPVANNQLYKYYHTHSAYLNTTSYESFGVAVVEAAACGIPIVSTDVGEIPFIWKNNKTILLCSGLDEKCFAEKVIDLWSNPVLSETISKEARKKADEFNWDRRKSLWLEMLEVKHVI